MIRDEATQRQVDAADPEFSTWLSANAGSGKTRVLTDRVARLLYDEFDPQNILCLTYTKAAAAEMQNRLFKRLGTWAMLDDGNLRDELRALGVDATISADDLARARRLFARAVETPGGLKIQTIHSFCSGLLRRFPLEAGVNPQFTEMEDRTAALLRTEVFDVMAEGPQSHLVAELLRYFTGADVDSILSQVMREKEHFVTPPQKGALSQMFGIDEDLTLPDVLASVFDSQTPVLIDALRAACANGSTTDAKAADKLARVNSATPTSADLLALEGVLLFGKSAAVPFGPKIDKFPTKTTRAALGLHMDAVNDLMTRIADNRDTHLALLALEKTRALYAFASVFVPAYEARKLAMGMLDFDDLIDKARALLSVSKVADWVLFRLDGGIDHLLVDEAQDTSPAQWAVIRHLTEEFGSGQGARSDRTRTLFVVGDKKQSIYSFQGADPAEFDRMQAHFQSMLAGGSHPLQSRELQHSFRSSPAILRVVDDTFPQHRAEGLGGNVTHQPFKADMPGRVDLWPVIEASEAADPENPWYEPVDTISDTHHVVQLANQIAAEIKRMTREETIPVEIGHTGTYQRRAVTEGDVLILVQRRSDLFAEIIRACKTAGLEIAGADRLRVGAELAVKDLAALLNFLALPEDDLSLASALRSPLFGLSEQDLFALAHYRPEGGFLWAALRYSDHAKTIAVLRDLLDQADFLRPYDLIERILTRHDGRRKLLARLGTEAEDGIDALLSQALAYESKGAPSLTGFLTWMVADDLEVKRQMDNQGNRIRVMTVHGAKGLEAPIVFLPDTAVRKNIVRADLLRADDHIMWKVTSEAMPAAMIATQERIKEAQEQERMRLLYVAMTRAEKWLIIAGAGDVGAGSDSWYSTAAEGIEHAGAVAAQSGQLPVRRVSHLEWSSLPMAPSNVTIPDPVSPPTLLPIPSVVTQATIAPSQFAGEKSMADPDGEGDQERAMARGRLFHALLEHLPAEPPSARRGVARQIIDSHEDGDLGDDTLVDDALKLITNDDLSHIFAEGTLAEVDVSASLPVLGGHRIHGAIDRLVITDGHVLAVDYKTNRQVPDEPETCPLGLLQQMGAYHAALVQIFPEHKIQVAILWTANGNLMPLPEHLVSDALNRVTIS